MRVVVVDTETTGVSEIDQVVELALVTAKSWSSLVRPSCPVSPEARAAHHITDEELADAPTMANLLERRGLPEFAPSSETVLVAHNAEFDRRVLIQSGVPVSLLPERTICTWRCALHLWPDAPRHSNQVLRYYLDLDVPPLDMSPHRALPDALVTLALLNRMLLECTMERLVKITAEPALLGVVRFGKYRGTRWQDLESGYLRWILKQDFDEDARHTARHWLRQRGE